MWGNGITLGKRPTPGNGQTGIVPLPGRVNCARDRGQTTGRGND